MTRRSRTELSGTFGRLTVVSKEIRGKNSYYLCTCSCGGVNLVRLDQLTNGKSFSCGCYRKEKMTKHGMSQSPEYNIWEHIIARCLNKNNDAYSNYGGRGISVCQSWLIFPNFLKDMGPRPSPVYSLDRVDNNGNYEPSNCRWATWSEQQSNRRPYHHKKRRV